MPAEWEPHAATWLSWPNPNGLSFPDSYDKVIPAFARMIEELSESETVYVNVSDEITETAVRRAIRDNGNVRLYRHPTNEPWCRDHGPIFVVRDRDSQVAAIDWGYNAWGNKYPPFDLDDAIPRQVAGALDMGLFEGGMVLEGGSVDVNGTGSLLTTEACLLNPNRNPSLSRDDIEARLKDFLGVTNVLWLGDGIEGDDTDGHVDDLTRFVNSNAVVTVVETDTSDSNFQPLRENLERLRTMRDETGAPLRIFELPMPPRMMRDGRRLPASYANFYIANSVVLLPVFDVPQDESAIAVLENAFPGRRIVGIDCRELIWGLGAFHCLTQQQPAPPVRTETS
jgi:agmatine deiminase